MKKSFILKILTLALCLLTGGWIFSHLDLGSSQKGCAFCSKKILKAQQIFEGKEVLALTTYKPATTGHLLIIPKRHVERFEDLTSSEITEMGEMVKRVDQVVKKSFKTTGSFLIQKNGREAGQSVPHVHIHYLPTGGEGRGLANLTLRFFLTPWLKPKTPEQMASEITLLQNEGRLS